MPGVGCLGQRILCRAEPATEPIITSGNVPRGVTVTGTQFSGHRFRFNSRGLLMDVNKSIFLENEHNMTRKIQVYVSGNSRIE